MDKYPRIQLNEIYDYLKRFHLSDSLFMIGTVNAAMRYGTKELDNTSIPPETINWIERFFPEPRNKLELMLHMSRIARFLLLSKANDYKDKILRINTEEMFHARNLVAYLYDDKVEGKITKGEDGAKVINRATQWQFPLQENKSQLIGRAYLLFIEIPQKIQLSYDIESSMKDASGISTFEFMATGFALGIISNGELKHNLNVEIDALKNVVTKQNIEKFIHLSSGTPQEYKSMLRGVDKWKEPNLEIDIYGLDPLTQIPIIKVKQSKLFRNLSYVVPQVTYLWQRASVGIFYILSDFERKNAEKEGMTERNNFRDAFGDIFKYYVGLQFNQGNPTDILFDFDKIEYRGKKPDFALINGDKAVLFEVKTGLLTVFSRYLSDTESIRQEIKNGQFARALNQIDDFENALNQGNVNLPEFKDVTDVVKVIVAFEDVYTANFRILPIADKAFGIDVTRNVQIATLMDIDYIGGILADSKGVVDHFFKKINDEEFRKWPIEGYLHEQDQSVPNNPLIDKYFNEFYKKLTRKK